MITKLYRKYVSQELRDKIYDAFLGNILFFFRHFPEIGKIKFIYLFHRLLPDTVENKLYVFMGKNGLTAYPYEYMLKYTHLPVNCIWDDKLEMFYIVHYGKKLYYPPGWRKKYIKENYLSLLIEQDIQSAHRYLENYERLRGKTILDIGAAEGMFSLDVIDIVNHVYLFECDTNWTKALNATFAAWKNKVTIVPKYVGNKNDEVNITIDRFLEGKDRSNLFLKMDIEGYEQIALDGAANTLKEAKDLDFSICTYHKKEDAVEIKRRLESCRFETEQTDGFLFYENDFRKAIIRRKI